MQLLTGVQPTLTFPLYLLGFLPEDDHRDALMLCPGQDEKESGVGGCGVGHVHYGGTEGTSVSVGVRHGVGGVKSMCVACNVCRGGRGWVSQWYTYGGDLCAVC